MQDFEWIRQRIGAVPRVRLALTPTPLQEAPHLSRNLGGPRVLIKRDDLTGVAFGGNKLRNLEFRLARALEARPDTIIVGLDVQSNSARQTAGACNKLGLRTVLVLEGEPPEEVQGNLLVDYLLGAEIVFAPTGSAQRMAMDEAARHCRDAGGRPYILNDDPMFEIASALAYLEMTLELLEQLAAMGARADALFMSSGGKGQAGLVLGERLTQSGIRVHGITATREHAVASRTAEIANRTAERLGLDIRVGPAEIDNDASFVGPGYGIATEEAVEAVRLFARTEGVILDPVYTGKAAAGMIARIRSGAYGTNDTVVFIHTGGAPAIFTWHALWSGLPDAAGRPSMPSGNGGDQAAC